MADYTTAKEPSSVSLSIPEGGLTKGQAFAQITKLDNQANAWRVVTAEANVELQRANAHKTTYNAVKAGISAATSFVGARTEFHRYTKALVDEQTALSDAQTAQLLLPLHLQKNQIAVEKAQFEVNKLKLEIQALSGNADYTAAMEGLKKTESLPGS